ncbi:MAG: lysozyme inhibitor LprI family protein [bacterium]|nr:lysozyme inhibitor LprI family protein [bacterium]
MMKKSMKSKIALAIMAASIMVTGCGNGTSMVGVSVTNSLDETEEMKSDTPEETTLQKTAPETDMNSEDEQAETDLPEAISETEEPEQKDTEPESLEEELAKIQQEENRIVDALSDRASQLDMNLASADIYKLWDDELNSLWSRFSQVADKQTKAKVLEEQREWIKNKEAEMKRVEEECEGGSITPSVVNSMGSDLTAKRCYELAKYLAQVKGIPFEPKLSGANRIEFVDRQGTPDIYSELTLDQVEGEEFLASIGLYRLTTFDGKAVRIDENLFEFEDDSVDVKGLIRITDDGEGATFEVTESTWKYVHAGDVFYFLERL